MFVCTSFTNQASSGSAGALAASPLYAPPSLSITTTGVIGPSPAITLPAVLLGMRTPEGDPFARDEAMSLRSDDTPQKRYQPRPGVNPDLTPTLPTTAILTPAPRTGDQDGECEELVYSHYDEL